MPAGGADLGFVAVAAVVAAVIWFSALRRWRMAVARREEVRRLAWLAVEEAERAEAEAATLAYVAPPLSSYPEADDGRDNGGCEIRVGDWAMPPPPLAQGPPQCAVCYRHTTTRCSRCKAVRYCSGKCQIIHWRQGHKDECYPPRYDEHKNSAESAFSLKGVQSNQSDLSEDGVEFETKAEPKPVETSPARSSSECNAPSVFFSDVHIEPKPYVAASGTESTPDSSADTSSSSTSSCCSTFSGLMETSDDASAGDGPHVFHYEKIEKSCHDISPEDPTTAVHTSKANLKKDPLVSAGSYVINLSCTSKHKVSNCKSDDTECRSHGCSGSGGFNKLRDSRCHEDTGESKHGHVRADSVSPCGVSINLVQAEMISASTNGIASSEATAQSNHKRAAAFSTEKSSSVASGRSSDVQLLNAKSVRAPSSFSSVDHSSSNAGTQPVPCDSSSKNENASAHFTGPADVTGSLPNGINDLKTSARRVVQQLKSSHLSKHSSGSRNDISRIYKMLFPYELFVKLYNCDKVDLRPCGLTNCGNSCYANAVLQCLAFTRPLTSYLLQGLHSRTCPRRDWCFTCEFESLLVKAKQGQSPLSPIGILSHIHNIGSNLGHGREEDAHEFLRYAIDTMQSVCLKEAETYAAGTLVEETTLVQLMFGGYLRSKIKCTRCRGKSERCERMMDLTVEIQGDIGTLEEALSRFTATEILDGENKYQCGRCKSYERAKKKLTVLEAPNVLTIALKRFQSGKFGKLNKAVRFPEILDLAPYMSNTDDKSPVYSLYAVVVHQDIMNAAFSGHYVCYVKSTQGKWYKTDDSRVKPVDIGSVLTKNAYMLFYARCSPRAPSLIRNALSHDKTKRSKSKDSLVSSNAPSSTQQRSHGHPPYRLHGHLPSSFRPSEVFNERLPFRRTDSSSDSSSLLSCSDEGSCSTESTRDSTSTEELSEFISRGSGRFSQHSSSVFSEDSDGFTSSPPVPRNCFPGENECFSYEERLGWERGEEAVGLEGRERPRFLYSDTSNQCSRKPLVTGECRGREETDDRRVKEVESNVLIRRPSTSRERRASQTFY